MSIQGTSCYSVPTGILQGVDIALSGDSCCIEPFLRQLQCLINSDNFGSVGKGHAFIVRLGVAIYATV